jgi:hypothetical protein
MINFREVGGDKRKGNHILLTIHFNKFSLFLNLIFKEFAGSNKVISIRLEPQ